MKPTRTISGRHAVACAVVALLLAVLPGPSAGAGEASGALPAARPTGGAPSARDLPLARQEVRGAGGFYRSHLLPRLTGQFRAMVPYEALSVRGEALADHPHFDRLSENARDRVTHGTRKALEDFLLEATSLDDLLDRLGNKARRSSLGGGPEAGGFGVGVGISHCAPSVELSRRTGPRAFRASLGLLGVVRVEYQQGRRSRASIYAGYDAREGDFALGGRIRF
jgi:hypothetical protein